MMDILTRPFAAAWRSLVTWQRSRIDDDPDVARARERTREVEQTAARITIGYTHLNRAAFGRDPWPRTPKGDDRDVR